MAKEILPTFDQDLKDHGYKFAIKSYNPDLREYAFKHKMAGAMRKLRDGELTGGINSPKNIGTPKEPADFGKSEGAKFMSIVANAIDFDPQDPDSVMAHQNKLNQSGFKDDMGEPLKVDGNFGAKTASANMQMNKMINNMETQVIEGDPKAAAGPLGKIAAEETKLDQKNADRKLGF